LLIELSHEVDLTSLAEVSTGAVLSRVDSSNASAVDASRWSPGWNSGSCWSLDQVEIVDEVDLLSFALFALIGGLVIVNESDLEFRNSSRILALISLHPLHP